MSIPSLTYLSSPSYPPTLHRIYVYSKLNLSLSLFDLPTSPPPNLIHTPTSGNLQDVINYQGSSFPLAPYLFLAGIIPSLWIFLFTHYSKPPPILVADPLGCGSYQCFVCSWLFLSFFICIVWIYLFATGTWTWNSTLISTFNLSSLIF